MRLFSRAAAPRTPPAAAPRFALVTRTGCHLCDEMAAELERGLGAAGEAWDVVDVDADPALRERFGEVVPVLLRDGVPVAKVRLAPGDLRRLLARRREPRRS